MVRVGSLCIYHPSHHHFLSSSLSQSGSLVTSRASIPILPLLSTLGRPLLTTTSVHFSRNGSGSKVPYVTGVHLVRSVCSHKTTADFSSTNTTYINTVLYNAPYLYCANPYAALLYAILFALPLLAHCFEAWRYHKFKLCWPIIMAGAWETLSFGFRVSSTQNQFTTNAFTFPSVILLLLAPLWINAFDYLVFGRMLYYFLPNGKIGFIRARRMSVIFVCLDVVAFLIQVTGGLMTNSTNANTLLLGTHIYTAGIAVQQFFILCFLGLIIYFHVKMSKGEGRQDRYGWKRLIYPLYATLLLITVSVATSPQQFTADKNRLVSSTASANMQPMAATRHSPRTKPMSTFSTQPSCSSASSSGTYGIQVKCSQVQSRSSHPSHRIGSVASAAAVARSTAERAGRGNTDKSTAR